MNPPGDRESSRSSTRWARAVCDRHTVVAQGEAIVSTVGPGMLVGRTRATDTRSPARRRPSTDTKGVTRERHSACPTHAARPVRPTAAHGRGLCRDRAARRLPAARRHTADRGGDSRGRRPDPAANVDLTRGRHPRRDRRRPAGLPLRSASRPKAGAGSRIALPVAAGWATVLFGGGYWLGAIPFVASNLELILLALVAISALPAVATLVRRTRPRPEDMTPPVTVNAESRATPGSRDTPADRAGGHGCESSG